MKTGKEDGEAIATPAVVRSGRWATLSLVLLLAACGGAGDAGQAVQQQDAPVAAAEPVEAASSAGAADDSSIVMLCAENKALEHCRCAMPAFAREAGDELAAYEMVAAQHLAGRARGMDYVEAWDGAIAAVAGELGVEPYALQARMNPVGRAHNAAVNACAQ